MVDSFQPWLVDARRTDLTSAQIAQKSDGRWPRDILVEELGVSKDKAQRLIRLTFLSLGPLAIVDAGRTKTLPAAEVGYLTIEEQERLLDILCASRR